MGHIPRSLIGTESEFTLQLSGWNTLLGRADQVDGEKPLDQRNVRVMEDRSGCDRVLIAAVHTFIQMPLFASLAFPWKGHDPITITPHAPQTTRPADTFQMLDASFLGIELGDDLEDALVLSHDPYPHFLGI